tara:strand:- start:259 stop:1053 length:795 start_codon:yes stop_codon:yes gene_type:complete
MTQDNFFLNLLEKVCRSNIYLFIFSRYVIGRFFSKIIYDSDFKVVLFLEKINFFDKKKLILDIGANDGMSYNIMRKFSKKTKIISFEPNSYNFKIIKKYEKKDKKFLCKKIALSNKNQTKIFFTPYFKNFAITQMAGLSKNGVKKRLEDSLYVKSLFDKIYLKKEKVKTIKLDNFNLKPRFIKIDIEGHEFECIVGSLKTIIKNKPIIMVEYDHKVCNKIFLLLKKYNYKRFIYNYRNEMLEKYHKQKVFNLFFIDTNTVKIKL